MAVVMMKSIAVSVWVAGMGRQYTQHPSMSSIMQPSVSIYFRARLAGGNSSESPSSWMSYL